MADDCLQAGKKRYFYTGNEVGYLNHVGAYNFVAGGPAGSGISAGIAAPIIFPNALNRRPWLQSDATFTQNLLDACYPDINLQWFAEIEFLPGVTFKVSDRAFYVQDGNGKPVFYDARAEKAPNINVTLGDWLSQNYQISDLQLTLNNRDGYYNQWLPMGVNYQQWSGSKITIKIGFGEKFSNYMTLFEGYITAIKGLTTTRDSIMIQAYDKFNIDQVTIPPNVYSLDSYPDVTSDDAGSAVPLVYGDWTVQPHTTPNQPWYGDLKASCINANDLTTDQFIFKISDVALGSITEAWLHRGDYEEGKIEGPVQIDLTQCIVQLDQGRFIIPVGIPVFTRGIVNLDSQTCGVGSDLNLITAQDDSGTGGSSQPVDFVALKIQVNDKIYNQRTASYAVVTSVAVSQIHTTGDVDFQEGDSFYVITNQYTYVDSDKISIKCTGKSLNLLSINKLSDVSQAITKPTTLAVASDGTFWIADDATQKIYHLDYNRTILNDAVLDQTGNPADVIYNVDFGTAILRQIAYADIDPAITSLSGVSITGNAKLWFVDPIQSKIYRYNLDTNDIGLEFTTASITGISSSLTDVAGIVSKSDNNIWIVDNATGAFYEVNAFAAANPFVVTTFNRTAFDSTATQILDLSYDEVNAELVVVDRFNNKCYRVNKSTGVLISSFLLTVLASNVNFVTGVGVAQDGSLFFMDQATLSIYNYIELSTASSNPALIARDMLQKFGGHTYGDFDLSWNFTANQLKTYSCRVCIDQQDKMITYIQNLLQQYNVAFFTRFGKFALFWITFDNFRTDGSLVKEKDIKETTFNPSKEYDQYFNAVLSNYAYRPFDQTNLLSDTYVSPAGVSFAKQEIDKTLDMPNVYLRTDLDRLMPLFVRLAVPEPEFVMVTLGFRQIRSQLHDFLTILFDDSVDKNVEHPGSSGRRFSYVPSMVRQMSYDLSSMTIQMKLWSLGNTPFNGYTPVGKTVGGELDPVVLSNVGRAGYIAPIGTITASGSDFVTLADVSSENAETRSETYVGLAWKPLYVVSICDGATHDVVETLIIDHVDGQNVHFTTNPTTAIIDTVKNSGGFITSGHYLQYGSYDDLINDQKKIYGSYCKPLTNYPINRTQEIEDQRAGLHSFADSGQPYILFPIDYTRY